MHSESLWRPPRVRRGQRRRKACVSLRTRGPETSPDWSLEKAGKQGRSFPAEGKGGRTSVTCTGWVCPVVKRAVSCGNEPSVFGDVKQACRSNGHSQKRGIAPYASMVSLRPESLDRVELACNWLQIINGSKAKEGIKSTLRRKSTAETKEACRGRGSEVRWGPETSDRATRGRVPGSLLSRREVG